MIILKSKERFRSEKHIFRRMKSVFSEVVNKTALSTNDKERIQLFRSVETYSDGTSKNIVLKKEKSKCNKLKKQWKLWLTLTPFK